MKDYISQKFGDSGFRVRRDMVTDRLVEPPLGVGLLLFGAWIAPTGPR